MQPTVGPLLRRSPRPRRGTSRRTSSRPGSRRRTYSFPATAVGTVRRDADPSWLTRPVSETCAGPTGESAKPVKVIRLSRPDPVRGPAACGTARRPAGRSAGAAAVPRRAPWSGPVVTATATEPPARTCSSACPARGTASTARGRPHTRRSERVASWPPSTKLPSAPEVTLPSVAPEPSSSVTVAPESGKDGSFASTTVPDDGGAPLGQPQRCRTTSSPASPCRSTGSVPPR